MNEFFDLIKRNIKFIFTVLILCIIASSITYAFGSKIIEKKNANILTYDEYIELNSKKTEKKIEKAGGDVNVDGGGGGNNTQEGTGKPDTILDNERDEGVRVTLVDAETFERVVTPIDFANNPRRPIDAHFGKEYKLWYIKNQKLSKFDGSSYVYQTPKTPLPKIIGGSIAKIKEYFGSEAFLRDYSSLSSFSLEELISGKYKFMLEPIGYPKIGGKVTACTATELALYDKKLNGYVSKSFIRLFSNRDLPLSMFLAKAEFGIKAYAGNKGELRSSDMIIAQLGVGAVTFKDEAEETPIPEYTYRTDTVVYTSLSSVYASDVLTGSSSKGYNVNPTTVNFRLSDTSNGATILETKETAYKSNDTVWVKWKTPSEVTTMKVIANIKYYDINDNGNYVWTTETVEIPIFIEKLEENIPPNPVADDRNENFKYTSPKNISSLNKNKNLSNSWKEYELEIGEVARETANGGWKITYVPLWTTIMDNYRIYC